MNTFSNVTVVGRITRDAEMRTTAGENSNVIVRFSLAVDRRKRDGDSYVEEANFFNVSFFGSRASSICMYLSKGSLVAVVGELVQRRYTDKEGNENQIVEILANNVHLIETKTMKEQRLQGEQNAQNYSSYNRSSSNFNNYASANSQGSQDSDITRFQPEKTASPDDFTEDDNIPF